MFVFEFDGALFALKANTPAFASLFQLPPRITAFFRTCPLGGAPNTAS